MTIGPHNPCLSKDAAKWLGYSGSLSWQTACYHIPIASIDFRDVNHWIVLSRLDYLQKQKIEKNYIENIVNGEVVKGYGNDGKLVCG